MSLRLLALAAVAVTVSACGTGPSRGTTIGANRVLSDPSGERLHAAAVYQAAESGRPTVWRTDVGPLGTVTPVGDSFTDASGRMCRVLRVEITRDAIPTRRDSTACRESDGTWVVTE